jgi:hypothetical protein
MKQHLHAARQVLSTLPHPIVTLTWGGSSSLTLARAESYSASESLTLARMLRSCTLYRPAMLRLGCSIGVAPLSTVKAGRGCLS